MEIVTADPESVRGTSARPDGIVGPDGPAGPDQRSTPNLLARTDPTWRDHLRLALRDPAQLIAALDLPSGFLDRVVGTLRVPSNGNGTPAFPLFAPWPYIARMAKGDPRDPLLRQVLPLADELMDQPGFITDPVGDKEAQLSAGLLQKYEGRALLITTGACAIHCRYCFRRHYPYSDAPRSPAAWQPALDQIAADPTLEEVILSGGDPLTLVDEHLAELAHRIARIAHIRRLRIHTRLPIVIPQRVTTDLLSWLRGTRLTPIMVVHANHPHEIDDPTAFALSRLVDAGIPVLNQSVLLRGVNDDAQTLIDLSRRLIDLRVIPYYLHQLDKVAGAAHFEVPTSRGLELLDSLRRSLPGYAIPRYVQELPGHPSKHPLA